MTFTEVSGSVVEAVGVRKSYGATTAVAGVDLSVRAGEVVAVLGPNGAGKTTLIEMLLGMRRPDAGQVSLFGGRPTAPAVKARVGAMLQEVDTPQALTVREIVSLVRHYYPRALPVEEVLRRADLSGKADWRASKLSGGQRQRLSFAMSIVGDPDLLFLDEPTAALDVEARRAFWEQVRESARRGTTVIFASHNMAEVEALADRVVVVHRGRLVADGAPAHIASSVATRRVEVSTDLSRAELSALPGVVEVQGGGVTAVDPSRWTLACTAAEESVRALLSSGARVERLVVTDADMETAFLHLISDDKEVAA